MIGPYDYADAVIRNTRLRASQDDRVEIARLFRLAISEERKRLLAAISAKNEDA